MTSNMHLYHFMLLIQWVEDQLKGEMIEGNGYFKAYLSVPGSISQKELNALCKAVNLYLKKMERTDFRICNSMGKFIPIRS